MELTQLRQFKVVAETENMSVAANEILFISQPTLSIAMKKLEEELGVQLFERKGKKLKLSEAGTKALRHVSNALDELEELTREMASFNEENNKHLTIESSGITMLNHFLIHYGKNHKLVAGKFNVVSESLIKESLLKGACDIGFTAEPILDSKIDYMPLCTYRTMVNVPTRHPLAKFKNITLEQLEGQKILGYDSPVEDPAVTNIYRLLSKYNISIERIVIPPDQNLFEETLKSSSYLSFYNSIAEADKPQTSRYRKLIALSDKETILTYYINYLKKNNAKVQQVRNWIRNNYADLTYDKPV